MSGYICKECGSYFTEPYISKNDSECRGSIFYETTTSSPCCFADYNPAVKCNVCFEYIFGRYIKYFDDRSWGHKYICEDCYTVHHACEDKE